MKPIILEPLIPRFFDLPLFRKVKKLYEWKHSLEINMLISLFSFYIDSDWVTSESFYKNFSSKPLLLNLCIWIGRQSSHEWICIFTLDSFRHFGNNRVKTRVMCRVCSQIGDVAIIRHCVFLLVEIE